MAAKKATPAWKRHELVTKAIFEALLGLDKPRNLDVNHNTTIKGRSTPHQIDVSWKFQAGDIGHLVIVEVKRRKGPAKKGDLLLFQSVLSDIPGQPRGTFVSETGYQKGALEVAEAAGIKAYEIREVRKGAASSRLQLTSFSVAFMRLAPGQICIEVSILSPVFRNSRWTLDEAWLAEHPECRPPDPFTAPTGAFFDVRFLDGEGNERMNYRTLVHDRIKEFARAGETTIEVEFPEPTYLSGLERLQKEGVSIGNLKIVRLSCTLDIVKTTETCPLFSPRGLTYMFKEALDGDGRYVLVAENGAELTAQLSVPVSRFPATDRSA